MVKKAEAKPFITEVPLTAEARELLLEGFFHDELPHQGELFVPTDSFYMAGTSHVRAQQMVRELCVWLGIKPGYIGLEFEHGNKDNPDGKRYTIYLESSTLADEFVLGAFLAYALTRYLLEERKQVYLPATDQQAALLASASIVFGLGLVIMNGITPSYNWLDDLRKRHTRLLKDFPLPNYTFMTRSFLRKHLIPQDAFLHSAAPWTTKRLGLRRSKRPSHAVLDTQHKVKVENMKLIGLCWTTVMLVGIGMFAAAVRVRPVPAGVQTAQQQANQAQQLAKLCKDSLAYDRQYADTSDIQTERALNAEGLRCQSLQNQSDTAAQRYNELNR